MLHFNYFLFLYFTFSIFFLLIYFIVLLQTCKFILIGTIKGIRKDHDWYCNACIKYGNKCTNDYNIHHASDSHKGIDDLSIYKCKNHECNLSEVPIYKCKNHECILLIYVFIPFFLNRGVIVWLCSHLN